MIFFDIDGTLKAACEQAGVQPEQCFYVGDNLQKDAEASARAGFIGIWLNRNGREVDSDVPIISSLQNLKQVVSFLYADKGDLRLVKEVGVKETGMMVSEGQADAMLAGVSKPTAQVISAGTLTIGYAEGISVVSSFFSWFSRGFRNRCCCSRIQK